MSKRELDINAIREWQASRAAGAQHDAPLPLSSLWDPFAFMATGPSVREKVAVQRAVPEAAEEADEASDEA